jgi:hypothetical protein
MRQTSPARGGHTIGALHQVVIDADGDVGATAVVSVRSDMAMAYSSQGWPKHSRNQQGVSRREEVRLQAEQRLQRGHNYGLNDDHCPQYDELPFESGSGRDDERPGCDIQLRGRHDGHTSADGDRGERNADERRHVQTPACLDHLRPYRVPRHDRSIRPKPGTMNQVSAKKPARIRRTSESTRLASRLGAQSQRATGQSRTVQQAVPNRR